jgi:hypothetical protein
MLPVYDINQTTEFTHPDDTGDTKTVFLLGVLDAKAQAFVNTKFTAVEMQADGKKEDGTTAMVPNIKIDHDGKQIEVVALGLKGVQNFGSPLTFVEKLYPFGKRKVVDDRSLDALKPYIPAIADAITKANEFTGADVKN